MSEIVGQVRRLRVKTATTPSIVWEQIASEIDVTFTPTSDKLEIANKDNGKHKKYRKTYLDHTVACTAHDNLEPTALYLGWADIYAMYLENTDDANRGEYDFEIFTAEDGDNVVAFTGFIVDCPMPSKNNEIVTYTFNIQVTALPDLTPVA